MDQFAAWLVAHSELLYGGLAVVGLGVLAINARDARARRAEQDRRRAAQSEQRFGRPASVKGEVK